MPYPDDVLDYGIALRIMGFEELGGRLVDQARGLCGGDCCIMERVDFPPSRLLNAAIERGKRVPKKTMVARE